jgi:hypothetical protein
MLIYNLGVILLERGELEAARAAFERSLAIREGAYGADHPEVAQSLNGLAAALATSGAAKRRSLGRFDRWRSRSRAAGPRTQSSATR